MLNIEKIQKINFMKHSKFFSSGPTTLFTHKNVFLTTNLDVCLTLMLSDQFFLELNYFQQNNFSRFLPADFHSLITRTCSTPGDNIVITDYIGHLFRALCSEMNEMSSLPVSSALTFEFNKSTNFMNICVDELILTKKIEVYNNKDLINAGQAAYSTNKYVSVLFHENYNDLMVYFTKSDTFGNSFYSTNNKSTYMFIKEVEYTKVFLPTYLPFLSPHLTSQKLYINLGLLNFISHNWNAIIVVILNIFFNGCTTLGFSEFFQKNPDGLTDSSYKIYLCKINTVLAFFILIFFLTTIHKNNREIYTAPTFYLEKGHQNEYRALYYGFLSPLVNELISVIPFNNNKVYSLVDIHNILIQ